MGLCSTRRTLCVNIGLMWTALRQSHSMDLMKTLDQFQRVMDWLGLHLLQQEVSDRGFSGLGGSS